MLKRLALLLLLFTPSCIGHDDVFRTYVIAHRLSYEAQTPDYVHYIDTDPSKTDAERTAIKGRLADELKGISDAERLLGIRK